MESETPTMRKMTLEECWEFLASEELGRLAYRLVDEVHITPINYAVDGKTLLFRTAGGEKLFGVALGGPVAFEIDNVEGETARSVIVRGHARRLDETEEFRADMVPLRPWVGTVKYNVVEIKPDEVTGRVFTLQRPWRSLLGTL